MSIPTISPYFMPKRTELPPDVAGWRPSAARAALLIHDMQNFFINFFPEGRSPRTHLLENVVRLRERCTELGIPVWYTAQPGRMTEEQRGLLKDIWGPGMTSGPEDSAIVSELSPAENDRVLTKWRYSAFHQSTLLEELTEQGRDQLIICGVYAHVGCLATAMDAYANNIQPFLVSDAIADFTSEYHRLAIDCASRLCAATPETESVLTDLSPTGG